MPIPLGVLAVAGAGGGAATSAFELLETQTLSGTQASITFSNLNTNYGSTYQHLQLRLVTRTSRTDADSDPILIRFNSDSGNNYARHGLRAGFGSLSSVGSTAQSAIFLTENSAVNKNASNIFTPIVADLLNPFEDRQKTVRGISGLLASGWYGTELWSGNWANTSAITTITLLPLIGANFVAGCRFSLYGTRIT
jgi:hypothetical protein